MPFFCRFYNQHQQMMAQQQQTMEQMITRLSGAGTQQTASNPTPEANHYRIDRLDPKHFAALKPFSGIGWKDWSFKFSNAAGASSALAVRLLKWAAAEQEPIEDFVNFEGDESDDLLGQVSLQIFYHLSNHLEGDALQKMHICNQSGVEGWRLLHKQYAPTTALRSMQLMMSVVNAPKAKSPREVSKCIDVWENRVLQLQRDFGESLSSRMKAAILVSMLPTPMQDSVFSNAERFEEYTVAREKVLTIAEAKRAISNHDADRMECDYAGYDYDYGNDGQANDHDDGEAEDTMALGAEVRCYRCQGFGHIAAKCPTPESKGKGKGKGGKGKGPTKGAPKGSPKGAPKGGAFGKAPNFCSHCGKRGHGPANCWTKQAEDSGRDPAQMAAVEQENCGHDSNALDIDLGGFEIAAVEVVDPAPVAICGVDGAARDLDADGTTEFGMRGDFAGRWTQVERRKTRRQRSKNVELCIDALDKNLGKGRITIDSGAAESVMPMEYLPEIKVLPSEGSRKGVQYVTANGGKMPNLGEHKVHFKTADGGTSSVVFQVTHARKPLASVSKIVEKGNRVVFDKESSYIENLHTGKRVPIELYNGTYHLDVEYVMDSAPGFSRQV